MMTAKIRIFAPPHRVSKVSGQAFPPRKSLGVQNKNPALAGLKLIAERASPVGAAVRHTRRRARSKSPLCANNGLRSECEWDRRSRLRSARQRHSDAKPRPA